MPPKLAQTHLEEILSFLQDVYERAVAIITDNYLTDMNASGLEL